MVGEAGVQDFLRFRLIDDVQPIRLEGAHCARVVCYFAEPFLGEPSSAPGSFLGFIPAHDERSMSNSN